MHSFRDAANRTWELPPITVGAARRVMADAGVDLWALKDDGLRPLAALLADPPKLVNVLYALLRDQLDAARLTDEAFGSSFNGDALEAASEAFVGALLDFFPARVRGAMRDLLDKGKAYGDELARAAAQDLAAFDPKAEARKAIDRMKAARAAEAPSPSSPPPPGGSGGPPPPPPAPAATSGGSSAATAV